MVTVAHGVMQRHWLVINPGTDAVITNIRVHRVSKVQRTGTLRQFLDIAMWGKHINLIWIQIDLQVLEEF